MAEDQNTHTRAMATFMITGAGTMNQVAPQNAGGAQTMTNDQGANADPPQTTDPQPAAAVPSVAPARDTAKVNTGFTLSTWAIGSGTVLLLGGVAILIMIFMRMRRSQPDLDGFSESDLALDLAARSRLRAAASPDGYATRRMEPEPEMAFARTTRLPRGPSILDE